MEETQGLNILLETIKHDKRHSNYNRTKEVAEFAYKVVTGQNQDDLITSVRIRESKQQKEQRIRLTQTITPVAANMVRRWFDKTRRVEGVRKRINSDNETAKEAIIRSLDTYYAEQSLESYLFDRLIHLSFTDPNTFIINEQRQLFNSEGRVTEVKTYPVEVPSREAINYHEESGVLKWLIVERKFTKTEDKAEHTLSRFYLYAAGLVIDCIEYLKEQPSEEEINKMGGSGVYTPQDVEKETGPDRRFVYKAYFPTTTEVPAIRASAYLDVATNQMTGVTPLQPAEPLLRDLINIKSLHDLTIYLHTFLRRWAYTEECTYEEDGYSCDGGQLNGHDCPGCKGTGDKFHTSDQDIIKLVIPAGTQDVLDLSKFSHTETVNESLPELQERKLDWLLRYIMFTVFNQEKLSLVEIAKTATEAMLNYQDIYDTLQPFTELVSNAYQMIGRTTAQYMDVKGVEVVYAFPKDYSFETEGDLIAKYQAAKTAGFDYYVLQNIQKEMIKRQTKSEIEAEKIAIWMKWRPFQSLTPELIAVAVSKRANDDFDKVLFENFDRVQREVEEETNGSFFLMDYNGQKTLIEDKVSELIVSIKIENPLGQPTFNLE